MPMASRICASTKWRCGTWPSPDVDRWPGSRRSAGGAHARTPPSLRMSAGTAFHAITPRRPRLLRDLGVLRVDHVHDDARLEHLREPGLDPHAAGAMPSDRRPFPPANSGVEGTPRGSPRAASELACESSSKTDLDSTPYDSRVCLPTKLARPPGSVGQVADCWATCTRAGPAPHGCYNVATMIRSESGCSRIGWRAISMRFAAGRNDRLCHRPWPAGPRIERIRGGRGAARVLWPADREGGVDRGRRPDHTAARCPVAWEQNHWSRLWFCGSSVADSYPGHQRLVKAGCLGAGIGVASGRPGPCAEQGTGRRDRRTGGLGVVR